MRSRDEYNHAIEQKYIAAIAEQKIRRRTLLISASSALMSLMLVLTALLLRSAPSVPSPKQVEIYTNGELTRTYTDSETINEVLNLLELFPEASPAQETDKRKTQYIVLITMSDGSEWDRCYNEAPPVAVTTKGDASGVQSPLRFNITFTIKDILDFYQ